MAKTENRKTGERGKTRGRKPTDGMHTQQFSTEMRISLPQDAPAKLVENIQTYSALVELQAKMVGASAFYQKLN